MDRRCYFMKKKHIATAAVVTAFCAATMTSCGVYGAMETDYDTTQTTTESVTTKNETTTEEATTAYDPTTEEPSAVYGPEEAY